MVLALLSVQCCPSLFELIKPSAPLVTLSPLVQFYLASNFVYCSVHFVVGHPWAFSLRLCSFAFGLVCVSSAIKALRQQYITVFRIAKSFDWYKFYFKIFFSKIIIKLLLIVVELLPRFPFSD